MSKVVAVLGAVAICLALVAAALASRAPTSAEKRAITHAFKTTHKAGLNQIASHFNVVGIRVTTLGDPPYSKASFVAKPRYRNSFQPGYGVAKLGKGGWKVIDVGSSGVGCGKVPKGVLRDLRLHCP